MKVVLLVEVNHSGMSATDESIAVANALTEYIQKYLKIECGEHKGKPQELPYSVSKGHATDRYGPDEYNIYTVRADCLGYRNIDAAKEMMKTVSLGRIPTLQDLPINPEAKDRLPKLQNRSGVFKKVHFFGQPIRMTNEDHLGAQEKQEKEAPNEP